MQCHLVLVGCTLNRKRHIHRHLDDDRRNSQQSSKPENYRSHTTPILRHIKLLDLSSWSLNSRIYEGLANSYFQYLEYEQYQKTKATRLKNIKIISIKMLRDSEKVISSNSEVLSFVTSEVGLMVWIHSKICPRSYERRFRKGESLYKTPAVSRANRLNKQSF